MLVHRVRGCRQYLEGAQPVRLRLAVNAGQQRRYSGGRPDLEPFASVRGRPGNADGIDEGIRHLADRLELFSAEVELLQGAGIVGEAVLADEVVIEVLGFRAHAADVERHPWL